MLLNARTLKLDNNVDLTTEERAVERQKMTDARNSANAAVDRLRLAKL